MCRWGVITIGRFKDPQTGLTDKQARFVAEYVIDNNLARAAARASVSRRMASNYKNNPAVRAALEAKQQKIQDNLDVIATGRVLAVEEIRSYLTSVMRGESRSYTVVMESYPGGITKHKLIEKPPEEKERLRAAELLGRHYGLFVNQVNLEAKTPIVIKEDLDG